jgi:hypothetical protein
MPGPRLNREGGRESAQAGESRLLNRAVCPQPLSRRVDGHPVPFDEGKWI